jgi:predicted O-methyltransferase YrrM
MSLKSSIIRALPEPIRESLKRARKSLGAEWRDFKTRIRSPNLYRATSPERIGIVYRVPTEMNIEERLFLYALIRGVRPERVLEIGSRHGGSAAIIACALEDNSRGRVIGVDPAPAITVNEVCFHRRFYLISQPSPAAIPDAFQVAGGRFDVVFIDGLHTRTQCAADLAGALPYAADGAYFLFHDAFHVGVSEAIREAIEADSRLHDCGYMCVRPFTEDPLVTYRGLRLVRFSAHAVVTPGPLVERGYREVGLEPPHAHPDLFDHDIWYCRHIEPCPRCRVSHTSRRDAPQDASHNVLGP